MKRTVILTIIVLVLVILPAMPAGGQTTYNLDIIWQKSSPDTGGGLRYWGFNMTGGDLNGDGYSDFVTATDSGIQITPQRLECRIYIFNGGVSLSTTPSQVIVYDSMGYHPSFCIADFNKDGYGDLAVGDSRGIGVNSEKGQVNIHYGTGIDLPNEPDLVIGGTFNYTNFGQALSTGDINGDGIDDLVVGAPYYGEMNTRGRVYIFWGDTLGLHTWPDIIINGHIEAGAGEGFGFNLDSGVDLNQDGYDDLLIGAYGNYTTGSNAGKVYIYHGGSPMDTSAKVWICGEAAYQWLGAFNVSSIPVDTNGFKPVGWFGTPFWPTNIGNFGEGKCYLVPGDAMGELTPLWTITGEDTGLGEWSSSAGYSDGDKLGDLLSGASKAYSCRGKVYLWLRRPVMRDAPDAYIIGRYPSGTYRGDVLGATVASAGDVDNCGKDEFLISNWYADTGHMIWLCKYTGPDGVEQITDDRSKITGIKLGQNYPNPFRQSTVISYQITGGGPVKLAVYNVAGQLVRTLTPPLTPSPRGEGWVGSVTWDGRDNNGQAVPNGVYFYKLNIGGESMVKKMTLLR